MPIKCLIIDDEPLAIQIIEGHIKQVTDVELVATFQNPLEAFELLKTETIDLIFLDIQMPLLTGIDFVKSMQQSPQIIFTTAHRDYAIESYELDVVDYLMKPITFHRFFKALNKYKALHQLPVTEELPPQQGAKHDHVYVNANKKFVKVTFDEMLYVESIKDYIRIHTPNGTIITKERISEFEKKLPHDFLRVHRSYIANTAKITAFTAIDIEIGDKEIPIGSSYKKEVIAFLREE